MPAATLAAIPQGAVAPTSIRNLPVNLFASVMGIAGLALAWRAAAGLYRLDVRVSDVIGWIAVAVFVVLAVAYATKLVLHPGSVRAEFSHPVTGNFFGTVAIALLLLSAVLRPHAAALSTAVWIVGVVSTLAQAHLVVSRLLRGGLEGSHALPALLIPGVATLDITVTGSAMPLPWAHEMNLLAVGVGTVLALVLLGLIVARLAHREPLPKAMTPSLMILVAPFEVGFLAYVNFTGRVDDFAALLYFAGLFLFFVLVGKVFRRDVPFGPGWWAISFPVAALVNAALRYAAAAQAWPLDAIAEALLLFLSAALAVLSYRTLRLLWTGKLLAG